MPHPTVCLNMIVKDEIAVLKRGLDRVRPYIDTWVISDTGSSDGTPELIERYFEEHGIPGVLRHDAWVDFEHNRNVALEAARPNADYVLVMDADDVLVTGAAFDLNALTADGYRLLHRLGELEFWKERLIRSDRPWRWEGVLHEYLTLDVPGRIDNLECDYVLSARTEGCRSRDPDKYANDARLLETALAKAPDHARYQFYLAQSYRDAGDLDRALDAYARRAEMGGWDEEVYYARYQAASLMERLGRPWSEVLDAQLGAWRLRPSRLEALHAAIVLCRDHGLWDMAYALAVVAAATPPSKDVVFVTAEVHRWRALDERALAASWTGRFAEATRITAYLLASARAPEAERPRLERNLVHYRAQLGERRAA